MNKWMPWFLFSFVGALGGCCVHSDAVKTADGVIDDITMANKIRSESVALVYRDSDDDVAPFCSGVWVDTNRIVTAEHCVRGAIEIAGLSSDLDEAFDDEEKDAIEKILDVVEPNFEINYITYEDSNGLWREPTTIRSAFVSSYDRKRDIAILTLKTGEEAPAHGVAHVAKFSPPVGSPVHIMGHPSALTWTYARGFVSSYREPNLKMVDKIGPWMQVSGPVWKGNSGGGAYNTSGELIGVASFISGAPHNGFFIHVESIRGALEADRP